MDSSLFEKFWEEVVLVHFPKAKVKFKDTSLFMKILAVLVYPFNREFSTRFITVIGTTVYFPSKVWLDANKDSAFKIVAHEFVHMVDSKGSLFYPIKYLFPQILILVSLLASLQFLSHIFLWYLVCIVFIIPFPAYWRTQYELNGYAMTMYIDYWFNSKMDRRYPIDGQAEYLANYFVSSQYYFMSWSRKYVIRELLTRFVELPKRHEAFIEANKWLKKIQPL
jgi:hypothetical protein